jgi:hypothetical protein
MRVLLVQRPARGVDATGIGTRAAEHPCAANRDRRPHEWPDPVTATGATLAVANRPDHAGAGAGTSRYVPSSSENNRRRLG